MPAVAAIKEVERQAFCAGLPAWGIPEDGDSLLLSS